MADAKAPASSIYICKNRQHLPLLHHFHYTSSSILVSYMFSSVLAGAMAGVGVEVVEAARVTLGKLRGTCIASVRSNGCKFLEKKHVIPQVLTLIDEYSIHILVGVGGGGVGGVGAGEVSKVGASEVDGVRDSGDDRAGRCWGGQGWRLGPGGGLPGPILMFLYLLSLTAKQLTYGRRRRPPLLLFFFFFFFFCTSRTVSAFLYFTLLSAI